MFAQTDTGNPAQLADQFQVNNYYAEQADAISRGHFEKLAEIDRIRGEALDAVTEEYARRNVAIFEDNAAAHQALSEQGLAAGERDAEARRIQTETQTAREELDAWRDAELQAITDEHVSRREAQIAATEVLYEQLREQRIETLERLLNGPVGLATLDPVAPPRSSEDGDSESDAEADADGPEMLTRSDDEQASIGTAGDTPGSGEDGGDPESLTRSDDASVSGGDVADPDDGMPSGGGIDLGGTVDLDTPGDEIVANANPDQHRLRERLFNEEVERRRRAEEEAASQLNFIQTAQAEALTIASASSQRREPNCEASPDADFDGAIDHRCGGDDCDDNNRDRYPGNTEVNNLVDEDCDPYTIGSDRDGDGFVSAHFCNGDNCGRDCDDSKPGVYPGASEICNYIDDDCDASVDDGVLATKYLDRDGDLHGDPDDSLLVCAQTGSHTDRAGTFNWLSAIGNDCDDADPTIWQGCSQ
ncbi:MAG: MopE-related protein [Woeseiaceae bacterium]|nr:MopE-related protein [Woeseiaceae bacterium]